MNPSPKTKLGGDAPGKDVFYGGRSSFCLKLYEYKGFNEASHFSYITR